jgi:hypothetical protein
MSNVARSGPSAADVLTLVGGAMATPLQSLQTAILLSHCHRVEAP